MTSPTSYHDLHCHSTRSDGVLAPAALVARAAERGVRALALTDHDEVTGLPEARAQAEACAIELISGVEISVTWRGRTIHVVGLHIQSDNQTLLDGLADNRSGRDGRAVRISAQLEAAGVPGALEGALSYVTNPALVSRTHFARFLVESGRVNNAQAAFDRYLGEGKPGYVPHYWATLQDAVTWIRAAGGLPVLAHPGRYKLDEGGRDDLLTDFKSLGGLAVEVVTGSHTPDQYGYWARRVQALGLLASAGSDFHGGRDIYRDLGDLPPLPSGCKPVWSLF